MNPRVLPASCRQINRSKALPTRCRQHLRGIVSSIRGSANKRMESSIKRPTCDPSQEGNTRSSASCPFPSREGLGVGSGSQ